MLEGLSTNVRTTTSAKCLPGEGKSFVIRYYSRTTKQPEKRITVAEAKALSTNGIAIGMVYEDGPTSIDYFEKGRGTKDAAGAYKYAVALGQPRGTAIYFALDYDVEPADIKGAITAYFQEVNAELEQQGGGKLPYQVGVYGGGTACKHLKEGKKLAKFSWLAESTGWYGSKTYKTWDIKQYVTQKKLCNLGKGKWERCEAQDDFGQFRIK
jgi:Domain of unknown function (DUF1906)